MGYCFFCYDWNTDGNSKSKIYESHGLPRCSISCGFNRILWHFLLDNDKTVQSTYKIRACLDSIGCFLCIHCMYHCCQRLSTPVQSREKYWICRLHCTAKSVFILVDCIEQSGATVLQNQVKRIESSCRQNVISRNILILWMNKIIVQAKFTFLFRSSMRRSCYFGTVAMHESKVNRLETPRIFRSVVVKERFSGY